jgi:thioredoxin-related protein
VNFFENSFLNIGFSWTLSKSLPYILVIIIGLLISIYIVKKIKLKRKWLKRLAISLLTVSFFFAYFAYSPIYEGDFSNNAEKVLKSDSMNEIKPRTLFVISIPGCPYCAQSIVRMKKLKKRNPKINIEYIVCNGDSTAVEWYIKQSGNEISVHLAKNNKAMTALSKHKYPSFVFQSGKQLKCWSNDGFGVRAMDEIESKF